MCYCCAGHCPISQRLELQSELFEWLVYIYSINVCVHAFYSVTLYAFHFIGLSHAAGSSPNDNLTIIQCSEDEVAIQWNIHSDLQFVAFEYSCIHPTNSTVVCSIPRLYITCDKSREK